jgi:hypothetical protein
VISKVNLWALALIDALTQMPGLSAAYLPLVAAPLPDRGGKYTVLALIGCKCVWQNCVKPTLATRFWNIPTNSAKETNCSRGSNQQNICIRQSPVPLQRTPGNPARLNDIAPTTGNLAIYLRPQKLILLNAWSSRHVKASKVKVKLP